MKWRGVGLLLLAFAALPLFGSSAAEAKCVRELPSSQNERPAFAAIGSIHTEKQSAAPARQIGLVRPRVDGLLGASTSASTNWAGYDIAGGTYTSATASWIQPSVQPDYSVDAHSAFWVGIDGWGNSTVEQCGTEAIDQYGGVSYYAWYEMYPAPEVRIPNLSISPGDKITATVTTDGNGNFTLTVADYTTGWQSTANKYSADAQDYSA